MGLYLHECKRMHYKATIPNSYLLCPFTRKFYPIDQLKRQLDDFASCFERDREEADRLRKEYVDEVRASSKYWIILDDEFNQMRMEDLEEMHDGRINIMRRLLPHMPILEDFVILV